LEKEKNENFWSITQGKSTTTSLELDPLGVQRNSEVSKAQICMAHLHECLIKCNVRLFSGQFPINCGGGRPPPSQNISLHIIRHDVHAPHRLLSHLLYPKVSPTTVALPLSQRGAPHNSEQNRGKPSAIWLSCIDNFNLGWPGHTSQAAPIKLKTICVQTANVSQLRVNRSFLPPQPLRGGPACIPATLNQLIVLRTTSMHVSKTFGSPGETSNRQSLYKVWHAAAASGQIPAPQSRSMCQATSNQAYTRLTTPCPPASVPCLLSGLSWSSIHTWLRTHLSTSVTCLLPGFPLEQHQHVIGGPGVHAPRTHAPLQGPVQSNLRCRLCV